MKTIEIKPLKPQDDVQILSISESKSITFLSGEFDPGREYALGVEMRGLDDKESIQFLHGITKQFLPAGTMYDIRADGKVGFYDPLTPDKVTKAAWFYFPVKHREIYNCLSGDEFKATWTPFTFEAGCFKLGPFFA